MVRSTEPCGKALITLLIHFSLEWSSESISRQGIIGHSLLGKAKQYQPQDRLLLVETPMARANWCSGGKGVLAGQAGYSWQDSFHLQQVSIESNGMIHFVGRSAASFLSFCSVPEDLDPRCVHVMERLPKCRKEEVRFHERRGLVEGSSCVYDKYQNLSLFDCKAKCRQNCSCIAFTLRTTGPCVRFSAKLKGLRHPKNTEGVILTSYGGRLDNYSFIFTTAR